MRILLTIHHKLDPDLGAPGATLALAKALRVAGCDVTTYGYQEAWPRLREPSVKHAIAFPYKTAAYLARNHHRFDILDMSTGDAHWWPLAKKLDSKRPVLITRSHGLEHLADEQVRADAAQRTIRLSRKYGIYHGGLRLREVARSLRAADGAIMLNYVDRDYAINRIGVKADRVTVIPNGVPQAFVDAPRAKLDRGPLRLVWVASWLPRKGMFEMIEAVGRLSDIGVDFHLLMLGTSVAAGDVLASMPERARSCTSVMPHFLNAELPDLLSDREVFVFPSHFEGFSMALVETMALGVAPIATAVGGAPALIDPNVNGVLIPPYDATALADAITRMAANRDATWAMGQRAREAARKFTWARVAEKTLRWYDHVRELKLSGSQ
jgi:glycosyltransferase involved in cell wall biosynthesis